MTDRPPHTDAGPGRTALDEAREKLLKFFAFDDAMRAMGDEGSTTSDAMRVVFAEVDRLAAENRRLTEERDRSRYSHQVQMAASDSYLAKLNAVGDILEARTENDARDITLRAVFEIQGHLLRRLADDALRAEAAALGKQD